MPVIPVAGSEKFANQPATREETLRSVGDSVRLHDVDRSVVDALDPLTYEVVRHRLTSITEEMGEALKRMSGSVVVTDCNDFDAAIMDEVGDVVQVGLYNTELAASLDMAANWTLRNRVGEPGHQPGGHVPVQRPVGRRWAAPERHRVCSRRSSSATSSSRGPAPSRTRSTSAASSPGSWSVKSTDVFWESLPTPPVKIVEGGVLRSDIEDVWLRRSRMPALVALDLRAKIGANNVGSGAPQGTVRPVRRRRVKAVMRRTWTTPSSAVARQAPRSARRLWPRSPTRTPPARATRGSTGSC